MKFQLYLGDCLELMKILPDKSVSLILADLPYGTTACAWDSVIPFESLWTEYRRIITDSGAIVLTASQPFTSTLIMSNPDWFKYTWVWEKENGTNFYNAKHQPLKVHEDVVVFSNSAASYTRSGGMTYIPQMVMGEPYRANNTKKGLMQFHTASPGRKQNNHGSRFPRSVLRFKTERGLHPTQKPVALMEYLVRTYSQPGDIVLDNVMGSGTTGVACMNTGRRFVGMELSEEYFALADERIAAAMPTRTNDNDLQMMVAA